MLETPVHKFHIDHGGQMVEFAGWSLPMKYRSIRDEHIQTRTSGSVFDVSHMGRFSIKGLHAKRLLERACSRRIGTMKHGMCRYTFICNETGGVRDDAIVMRMDDDDFLLVCNGANREKIGGHLEALAADRGWKVKLDDRTLKTAMVAVQGPKVMELIATVSSEVPALKRFRFTVKNLLVAKLFVSRTGYTGENGVEVILPAMAVPMAMKMLMKDVDPNDPDAVLKPAGLGARDTLRIEAAMPLYGHELGEDIPAMGVGMGFALNLDKSVEKDGETFVGQEAIVELEAAGGPRRRLVGIELEGKRTARQGMPVLVDGEPAGEITSGCMSPTLEKSIAMAYVCKDRMSEGTVVTVDAGRAQLEGRIVPLPFYKAG